MTPTFDTNLPISETLPDLSRALVARDEVVLSAPPGAGKTTIVPLALAGEAFLGHKKILMLEPRRIAARAAAHRMAQLMREKPGGTVGYRMRLETVVSERTRIEVITEGVLVRMLQQDPSLEGVGLVIFDEFHERNLDSDLSLALCLKGRELFREDDPLKLLVMSATIDVEAVARLMGDAPVIQSEGRAHPVEIIFGKAAQPRGGRERVVDRMVPVILKAVADNPGSSVLAFLPGQGEIAAAAEALQGKLNDSSVDVYPMYGNLPIERQQDAIQPPAAGKRKIVLATNIAETSLTIEGVDVVVDSGLERVPAFDPATGMTRLATQRISDASSAQRAGRAGRLRPGRAYRLWSRDQQHSMARHATPEISGADLAPLALQLMRWGIDDPAGLRWLDPPPQGAFSQAMELLRQLGAAEGARLTAHGDMMAEIGTHPRLAHMLIKAKEVGLAEPATLLAATFSDRDPFAGDAPDMDARLDVLTGREACPGRHRGWLQRTRQQARQFADRLDRVATPGHAAGLDEAQGTGYLLALAYPDRIARRRHAGGYQLANGRSAKLDPSHYLGLAEWLAVAEVGGMARRQGDQIRSAAKLDPALFDGPLGELAATRTIVEWKAGRFVAERQKRIGALVMERRRLDAISPEEKAQALLRFLEEQDLAPLNWTREVAQLRARVALLRKHLGDDWPDWSMERLAATTAQWLAPRLHGISRLADFRKLNLKETLEATLPYEQRQRLDALAPQKLQAPSGARHALDYTREPPVLAVKLQEMFGRLETPAVANGKVPVMVHLLSPAGRPLQVTQDLAHFWQHVYADVRKEMKGRYPRHPWPEDPLAAQPTRHAKRRK